MRLTIVFLAICLAAGANGSMSAQSTAMTGTATETIAATELSQKEQWHNLKRWVALTFDKSDVIDMEDAERGTMVIKWSYPVKFDSDFISAAVTATYLVDVRDGKYRLKKISPRVSFQFMRSPIMDEYDNDKIIQANADIRLLNGLASQFFGGSFDWPIDSTYDEIASAYLEYAEKIDKYKSDRDRDRNKVSDEWARAERNWSMLNTIKRTYREIDASMSSSLDTALKENDDF